jgi:endonuclease III
MKKSSFHEFSATVYKRLEEHFGQLEAPLNFSQDYELAVAVILSAQCTDERVNQVTVELFKKYPTLQSFAEADLEELEEVIFPTGFFRNKARMIKGFASKLITDFGGKLPSSIAELTSLPGFGRKTANVIINEIFGKAEGIVVDTHVKRISVKLGLTEEISPDSIEYDLMEKIEKKYWRRFSLYLIYLGRKFCKANRTECLKCPLNDICPSSSISVKK